MLYRKRNRMIGGSGWSYVGAWVFLGDLTCLGGEGEESNDRSWNIDEYIVHSMQDLDDARGEK